LRKRKLAQAAGGEQGLAGEPTGVCGRQEDRYGCDVAGLAGASERSLGFAILLPFSSDEADGMRALGLNEARIDGVDANLPGAKLFAEDPCDGIDGTLGSGVGDSREGWSRLRSTRY
jgi:hypothetical protein